MDRILKNETTTATAVSKSLGTLVIADAKSTYEKLNDTEFLKGAMLEAAKAGGLNIMDIDIHRFEPHGITAIFVLKESHFSVHTWPEFGQFSADIFSCGAEGDASAAMKRFLEIMGADQKEVKHFERGILRDYERALPQDNGAGQGARLEKERIPED